MSGVKRMVWLGASLILLTQYIPSAGQDAADRETWRLEALASAKTAARASLEILDHEYAALVALQAFRYQQRYEGIRMDADIDRALANVLARFGHSLEVLEGRGTDLASFLGCRGRFVYAVDTGGQLLRWVSDSTWLPASALFRIPSFSSTSRVLLDKEGKRLLHVRGDHLEVYELGVDSRVPIITFRRRAPIQRVAFAQGQRLLTISEDGNSVEEVGRANRQVLTAKESIDDFQLSPGGEFLAYRSRGRVSVVETASAAKVLDLPERVTAFQFLPTGNRLLVGTAQGELQFYGLRTSFSPFTSAYRHQQAITTIVLSPNMEKFATLASDNSIRVWSLHELTRMPLTIDHAEPVHGLGFSVDGKYLLVHADHLYLRPVELALLAKPVCGYLKRNMMVDEWDYFFSTLPYEQTCTK